jgi:hypothetical protein
MAATTATATIEPESDTMPEGFVLYYYEPKGLLLYNSSVFNITSYNPSGATLAEKMTTVRLHHGVQVVTTAQWKIIAADPFAQELIAEKNLYKITEPTRIKGGGWTDGRSLITDLLDVVGTTQKMSFDNLLPRLWNVKILEEMANWISTRGFLQVEQGKPRYDAIMQQIEDIKEGRINYPRYSNNHPKSDRNSLLQSPL